MFACTSIQPSCCLAVPDTHEKKHQELDPSYLKTFYLGEGAAASEASPTTTGQAQSKKARVDSSSAAGDKVCLWTCDLCLTCYIPNFGLRRRRARKLASAVSDRWTSSQKQHQQSLLPKFRARKQVRIFRCLCLLALSRYSTVALSCRAWHRQERSEGSAKPECLVSSIWFVCVQHHVNTGAGAAGDKVCQWTCGFVSDLFQSGDVAMKQAPAPGDRPCGASSCRVQDQAEQAFARCQFKAGCTLQYHHACFRASGWFDAKKQQQVFCEPHLAVLQGQLPEVQKTTDVLQSRLNSEKSLPEKRTPQQIVDWIRKQPEFKRVQNLGWTIWASVTTAPKGTLTCTPL